MTDQENAIAQMNISIAAAAKLELTLRFKGKGEDADAVAKKRAEIIRLTEDLLARAMAAWGGGASTITAEIAAANSELEGAIKGIKRNVKTASQIVKAAEKLDDIIKKAAKYLITI